MAKSPKTRRTEIIRELSQLSRNGWAQARPVDYLPLEAELRDMDDEPEYFDHQAARFDHARDLRKHEG